jgi:diguanylate cyclase (GGDEF)-like protein
MSLRRRLLALFVVIFVIGGLVAHRIVTRYADDVASTLGAEVVERHALLGQSNIRRTVSSEVVLAQKLASSKAVRAWLANESDPTTRATAIAELDADRRFLRSRSYFLAHARSGNYYYADDDGSHDATAPRYTLSPDNPKDGWFYATLKRGADVELNVDTDRHLGVTSVWINVPVRSPDGEGLAVAGSGVRLTEVIESVVRAEDDGVMSMLVDADGAIQAHADRSKIDWASARKSATNEIRSTIFDGLGSDLERRRLREAFARLAAGGDAATALPLTLDGASHFVGIAYIPEIRWYVVTSASPAAFGSVARLPEALPRLAIALMLVLVGVAFLLERLLFARLSRLDASVRRLGEGHYELDHVDSRPDELGRLATTLRAMADRIARHTHELENQVRERTAELEAIALTDPLTACLNRRGMTSRLEAERNRHARGGQRIGVLLLDLDHFKRLNDQHGHAAGDAALVAVAKAVRGQLRDYDAIARWGGEEFLVGAFGLRSADELERVADKILAAVRGVEIDVGTGRVAITTSIGAALVEADATLDSTLQAADDALYTAKSDGRDRVVIAGPRSFARRTTATVASA